MNQFSDNEPALPDPGQPGRSRRRAVSPRGAILAIALGSAVLLLALNGCGGDEQTDGAGGTAATEAETVAAEACEQVDEPAPKDVDLPAPDAKQPSAKAVVFETSCGSFTVTLDAERAPKTAASFQYLAEEGVYDGTAFHRVAPEFVIQGGDPSGDGTGGPGYSVTERPPADLSYTRGLVAMAKTGAEPPGTSGSQFFVVTAPADAALPPDFALVGEVTEGLDTVLAIEALGTPGADGPPSMPVVITGTSVEG